MRGKVSYTGHALHNKTVEIEGEDLAGDPSLPLIPAYRIRIEEGHEILLPKTVVRVLAEVT